MYKVVIIDDEPIILKGLTQLVPWKDYECEVAGTAEDGMEGLALIRKLHPDIVFSDIYMPKMDGLIMAAALKSEFEDIELTILTGYRDFDLVQQALRLGVTRFILKPSNMEELEEALRVMTEKLKKKGLLPEKTFSETPKKSGEEEKVSEEQAGSFLVNSAISYMKKHYKQKLTLTEVAENVYVSQWHLSKLLNRHTGQSFSELLNTIRVDEAKKLLKNPALRIGDIAEAVGFLDMTHFSRVFKKLVGISANEYRNQIPF
jgi:two-component system response regulator YesN